LTPRDRSRQARARRSIATALCLSALGLALVACKHDRAAPAPSPAPLKSADDDPARESRFDSELKRSRAFWQIRPNLGNCADLLPEKSDSALCEKAAGALSAIEQLDPSASGETAIGVLGSGSLALARLVERARYLSLEDLGKVRLSGDASPPTPSAEPSPPAGSAPLGSARTLHEMQRRRTLRISDSPLSRLVQNAAQLEHEALRNFAAYLEYAPLSLRRAALDRVKSLRAEHPQWAALARVVREAAVLETDASLKQNLDQLASLTLPQGKRSDQPMGSK